MMKVMLVGVSGPLNQLSVCPPSPRSKSRQNVSPTTPQTPLKEQINRRESVKHKRMPQINKLPNQISTRWNVIETWQPKCKRSSQKNGFIVIHTSRPSQSKRTSPHPTSFPPEPTPKGRECQTSFHTLTHFDPENIPVTQSESIFKINVIFAE